MKMNKQDKVISQLSIKQEANTADMYFYGEVVTDSQEDSEVSAVDVRNALKNMQGVNEINLHINSPGGNVFDGVAIYNMLKQNPATVNVYVDALAGSIASVIAMAGDKIYMPANSEMMIHNPSVDGFISGNAQDLRKMADSLDKIGEMAKTTYLNRADGKVDKKTLENMMDAETWLTADEAVDYGLADEVLEANKAVACVNTAAFCGLKNVPEDFLDKAKPPKEDDKPKEDKQPAKLKEPEKQEKTDDTKEQDNTSFADIAEKARLSAQAVRERLKNLEIQ